MTAALPRHRGWGRRRGGTLVFVALLPTAGALAQAPPAEPVSYEAATMRLGEVSDGLAASTAQVRARQAQAGAVATLRRPEVSIDVRELEYQKSLTLSTGTVGPSLGLPSTLDLAVGGWAFRPVVSAVMPLYSGGQIGATQNAALAGIREAEAGVADTRQSTTVQLVQAYFGQQLATAVLAVRTDARAGLQRHFDDALKLEKQGFASRAQALQAQVARDDAERDYQKARNDLATATAYLANLLHSGAAVVPTTPLFVVTAPLDPLDAFVASAAQNHPQVGRLGALGDQAREGVRIQQAKQRPQVYLFGQYDLNRREALFTEPDYVYGIGLKYTFWRAPTAASRCRRRARRRRQPRPGCGRPVSTSPRRRRAPTTTSTPPAASICCSIRAWPRPARTCGCSSCRFAKGWQRRSMSSTRNCG
ncbi:MAG: transporter [Alphaproteobacteria bacterium]|nr:MAG: transporter [Alphaproteobacteria bacterium]